MRTIGFALYLACSWTWCIGMYLPTLLVRDGGKAAFLAFFIPNVIGAASVGWVLAGRARSFFESKRPIVLAFTAVTIAFHGYWVAWMVGQRWSNLLPEFIAGMLIAASIVMNAVALTKRVRGLAAAVTLLFSLGTATALMMYPAAAPWMGDSVLDLIGLAAVCALGFGLCPYLDLTFNKAAIESKRPRLAFTLGFAVFALVLLVVTRGHVLWSGFAPPLTVSATLSVMLIGAHFGAQTTFTIAAHAEATRTTGRTRLWSYEGLWLTLLPALIGLALGGGAVALSEVKIWEMPMPEVGYRGFLAAYGLVFPVWLLLTLGGPRSDGPGVMRALAVTCLAALPFFTYGFVALREVWLLPGIAVLAILVVVFRASLAKSTPSPTPARIG